MEIDQEQNHKKKSISCIGEQILEHSSILPPQGTMKEGEIQQKSGNIQWVVILDKELGGFQTNQADI